MINSEKLKHVLNAYRKDFHKKDKNKNNKSHWDCEKYKWVAVNHFQKNWNMWKYIYPWKKCALKRI